jgi:hypothetical protein
MRLVSRAEAPVRVLPPCLGGTMTSDARKLRSNRDGKEKMRIMGLLEECIIQYSWTKSIVYPSVIKCSSIRTSILIVLICTLISLDHVSD